MINLLFIPGLLCDKTLWQPVPQAFKNSYHTQIIDIAPCGTIEEFSRTLSQDIDKKIVVVGFSLGSWVAFNLCSMLPNFCKGLILISSALFH